MRLCAFLWLALASAVSAQDRSAAQPPRIERLSNGVIVVRGSAPAPAPPEEAAQTTAKEADKQAPAEGESPAAEPEKKAAPEPPKPPRRVNSSASVATPGGGTRAEAITDSVRRSEGVVEAIKSLENLNGRSVPYLTDKEETLSKTATAETKQRRVQRYDASGQPTQQELTKIEKRKLPDGTVVTTETLYQESLNGRMEAIERKTTRESSKGAITRTVTSTDAPSVNGGFQTVMREESVERKLSENSAERETTRSARVGGSLAVVGREQSKMSKSGATSTTETTVYERDPATNQLGFTARKIGRLTESADGSQTEKVETYGFKTASGATNLNATRPQLQEVVNRRVSVGANGEVRESKTVQQRGVADTGALIAGPSTETVVRPTADGESRRTEVYEQGVNGRRNPTRVVVEQVEK